MTELTDMHHKMSKKIAQLTKVIFHLNTKNDEASLHHQAQAEAYEKEIHRIVIDTNEIIKKQRETLKEQGKAADTANALNSLKTQHEEAKDQAREDLSTLQEKMRQREVQIRKDAKEQIEGYHRELAELKTGFEQQITQFEGKQLTSHSALDEFRRSHKTELESYVKEQSAKYSQLLQDKMDAGDSYEERIQEQHKRWGEKLKEAANNEREKYEALLSTKNCDFVKKLQKHELTIEGMTTDKMVLKAEFQRELSKLNETLREWESKYASLSADYKEFQVGEIEKHRGITGELDNARKEITELSRVVSSKEATIQLMKQKHQETVRNFNSEINNLQTNAGEGKQSLANEITGKIRQIESLQQEMTLIRKNLEESRRKYREIWEELENLKIQFENERRQREKQENRLKNEKNSMTVGFQEEIEESTRKREQLERSHQTGINVLKQEIENFKQEKDNFKQELENLKQRHSTELAHKELTHTDALSKLTNELDTAKTQEIHNLKESFKEEKLQMSGGFERRVLGMTREFEEKLNSLEERIRNKEGISSEMTDKHSQEISVLQSENEKLAKKLRDLTEELSSLSSDYHTQLEDNSRLRTTIETLNEEIQLLKQSGNHLEDSLKEQISTLKAEIDNNSQSHRDQLIREIQGINDKYSQMNKEIESKHSNELEKMIRKHQEILAKYYNDSQSSKEQLGKEIRKTLEEKEQLETEWAKKCSDLAESYNTQINSIKLTNDSTITQMEEFHSKSFNSLKNDSLQQIESLKSQHLLETQTLRKEADSLRARELSAQAKSQEEKLQQITSDCDRALSIKALVYEKKLKALQDSHRGLLNKRDLENSQLANNLNTVEQAKKRLESDLAALESHLATANEALANKDQQILELEQRVAILHSTYQNKLLTLTENSNRNKDDLKSQFKAQWDSLIKDHLEQMSLLKTELDNTAQLMEERYNSLQQNYDGLQELYDNRPPRDGDLALIEQLRKELGVKEGELKKAYDDMKFFRLELLNREDNYNKVFGTAPTVGILNPILNRKTTIRNNKATTQRANTMINQNSLTKKAV